jgi:hypothetical protein
MCTTGTLPTQQPSARSGNSTHMSADKKHCLHKPGFKNDDPVSSQACVGQTPLPLKVLHSSCFGERSGGLFCSLLCQRRMEQAFKYWVSSLHKRLWAKQSRDEQGHGLLGPSGHLRATKANQSWLATVLWGWGKYVAMVMVQHQPQKSVRETPGVRCAS